MAFWTASWRITKLPTYSVIQLHASCQRIPFQIAQKIYAFPLLNLLYGAATKNKSSIEMHKSTTILKEIKERFIFRNIGNISLILIAENPQLLTHLHQSNTIDIYTHSKIFTCNTRIRKPYKVTEIQQLDILHRNETSGNQN